jgi:hypothetical protein
VLSVTAAGRRQATGGLTHVHCALGSWCCYPPLVLFAPAAAAAMTAARGVAPLPKRADWNDAWDDEFLAESALVQRSGVAGGAGIREALEECGDAGVPAGMPWGGSSEEVRSKARPCAFGATELLEGPRRAGAQPWLTVLPGLTPLGLAHAAGLTADEQLGYMPLDEAIVRAVERGKSTEVKRRLYGTILLTGGVARTPGLARYLEWRISLLWKLAADATEGIERVEVPQLPAGVAPEALVWRGAATSVRMDAARPLWVLRSDWASLGVLAPKEFCAFTW